MNRLEFDSIWWKHKHEFFAPIGKPRVTYCQCFFSDRNDAASHASNTRLTTTIVDESHGVHGRVRAAASPCFVLAAQARKLLLSASLGWVEEAQKLHAWNSNGDAAIIEVLSYPLCFRSLRLIVVSLGRSSKWQHWACDRHYFFEAPPPGYAVR